MEHPFVRQLRCCCGHWWRPGTACLMRGRRCRLAGRASSLIFAQWFRSLRMQQHAALEQRKSRLPVGTAFDPLHFIHEPLNHSIAPGHAASVGNSLRIVSQPINKSDELGNPTGPDSDFPLLQAHLPLVFSQQTTKILRQREHHSDGRVTLDKVLQIGRLRSRAVLCGSHHHKCNPSGRRRLVPDDGLFRDRARSFGTKGAQPHLKCTPRTRVSLSHNFLIQPGYVMAPLVPS